MRLEEVLKYRRKGYDIKRLGWDAVWQERWLSSCDIDADDWEVVRKRVSWPEAWEALQQGKVVAINDPNTTAKRIRLASKEEAQSDALECAIYCWYNPVGKEWGWYLYGTTIPMRWLSRNDFEIVEDE